jgi:hypothetical protein
VLPWAQYGDIDVPLDRFLGWGFYVTAAVALSLFLGWQLAIVTGDRRLLLLVGTGLCITTVGTAIAIMLHYDDATALFGPVVPLVTPRLGPGGRWQYWRRSSARSLLPLLRGKQKGPGSEVSPRI